MKITFLSAGVFGIGGGIRATVTLANALAEAGAQVELLGLQRTWNHPKFHIDPRVRVAYLYDERGAEELNRAKETAQPLSQEDERLRATPCVWYDEYGEQDESIVNTLTQRRLREYLESAPPDVLVTTKPKLHILATGTAPAGTAVVAHAHTPLSSYHATPRRMTVREAAKMAAIVTVSQADTAHYRELVDGTEIVTIPNPVPAGRVTPSAQDSKIIMAAGRLAEVKRYELLIAAFSKVAARHLDWRLRLYGAGGQGERLRRDIHAAGLSDRVLLMGRHALLESEWPKASLSAVTSEYEAFGLTIVEAMRGGVPVVSFDCDTGPREIITSGDNGVLVPNGDVPALAAELDRLMSAEEERQRLAKAAITESERYGPDRIAARHLELYSRLRAPAAQPRQRLWRRAKPAAQSPKGWRVYQHRDAVPRAQVSSVNDRVVLTFPAGTCKTVRLAHKASGKSFEVDVLRDPGRRELETARVRLTHQHPAGVWTVHAGQQRVVAETLDTRELTSAASRDGDSHTIPFLDDDERLALRHWDCRRLAELTALRQDEDGLVVTVKHPRELRTPQLIARLRKDREKQFTVSGDVTADVVAFTLPITRLTSHRATSPDQWDLWIREADSATAAPAEGAIAGTGEWRICRVRDDITSKKRVFAYPDVMVDASQRGAAAVRAYYTDSNMLSVRVADMPF